MLRELRLLKRRPLERLSFPGGVYGKLGALAAGQVLVAPRGSGPSLRRKVAGRGQQRDVRGQGRRGSQPLLVQDLQVRVRVRSRLVKDLQQLGPAVRTFRTRAAARCSS